MFQPHTPQLSRETSLAIRVARPLCIFFMISVHFTPGDVKILAADLWPPVRFYFTLWLDYLGRSSVPLLSLVSGILLAVTYFKGKSSPVEIARSKFRTLIVPMVIWSAILLLLFSTNAMLTGNDSHLPVGMMGWINSVFALTGPPINFPLSFLRDMFTSVLLGLGVLMVYRRHVIAGIALMVLLPFAVDFWGSLIVMRPMIVQFMFAGMLLAVLGFENFRFSWTVVLAALLALVLITIQHERTGSETFALLRLYGERIAMSMLMWKCAVEVASRESLLRRILLRFEPEVFLIFCSHRVTIAFLSLFAGIIGMTPDDPSYIVFFMFQYVVIITAAVVLSVALRHLVGMRSTAVQ